MGDNPETEEGSKQGGAGEGGMCMRDPTIRFALHAVALTKLQEVARERNLSLRQLLKNLAYQAINDNRAARKGREVGIEHHEHREHDSRN
jgi:hypothetical protein